MKHNKETYEDIDKLLALGYSSRQIAEILVIGKSTVNDYRNRTMADSSVYLEPKIAVIDTETAAALSYHFGRFNINVSQNAVVEEGGQVLVACWKWLGDTEVQKLYMTPREVKRLDDRRIIKELYNIYLQSDAVVMHNAKKFDHKVIQTRGIYHGFGMLPNVVIIDTLEIAKKKLRLPSNRLDSIGAYFGLGRKIDTGGIELWKQVQSGDIEAMHTMVEYCVQDVELLEQVVFQFVALGAVGFNAGHYYNDDHMHCKSCGSTELTESGRTVKTAVAEYTEYHCSDCGHYQRGRISINSKSKRRKITA